MGLSMGSWPLAAPFESCIIVEVVWFLPGATAKCINPCKHFSAMALMPALDMRLGLIAAGDVSLASACSPAFAANFRLLI